MLPAPQHQGETEVSQVEGKYAREKLEDGLSETEYHHGSIPLRTHKSGKLFYNLLPQFFIYFLQFKPSKTWTAKKTEISTPTGHCDKIVCV